MRATRNGNTARMCGLLVMAFVMICCSCVRRPEGVRSDDEMASVVADMEIAEAYMRVSPSMGGTENREALTDYVLEKNGMSRADYDSTMSWYAKNPDQYYEFCDKVNKQLEIKKRKYTGQKGVQTESTDLWPYSRMAIVSTLSPSSGLEFSIPTADVTKGQVLKLRMRMLDMSSGTSMIGVQYDNGTSSYVSEMVKGRNLEVNIQTDTALTVNRIFGHVMFDDDTRRYLWIDSITLTAQPYDSMQYYKIRSQKIWREPRRKPKVTPQPADSVADESQNP